MFGRTTVQCAAITGRKGTLRYMLNPLRPEEQIQLLETQLTHDVTAAELARKYEHYETANLLQRYRTTAEAKIGGENKYTSPNCKNFSFTHVHILCQHVLTSFCLKRFFLQSFKFTVVCMHNARCNNISFNN